MSYIVTVSNRRAGLSIVEMIVILAILGVLIGIGAPLLRTQHSRIVANSVQATVQQARFEAIKRNRPIAVNLLSDAGAVELSASSAFNTYTCTSGTLIRTVSVTEQQKASIQTENFPFLWLPNGQPRNCSGAHFSAAQQPTAVVSDAGATYTVAIGPAGEVTVK